MATTEPGDTTGAGAPRVTGLAAARVRAVVALAEPARIMVRLAKHFEHRVAVQRTDSTARVDFPTGTCSMVATGDTLELVLESAVPADLGRYREVVARHLRQVAHDETIAVDWQGDGGQG